MSIRKMSFIFVLVIILLFTFGCPDILKKYEIRVVVGENVIGTPTSGTYTYRNGEAFAYNYTSANNYSSVKVTLNGSLIQSSGAFIVKGDGTLRVEEDLPEEYKKSDVKMLYFDCEIKYSYTFSNLVDGTYYSEIRHSWTLKNDHNVDARVTEVKIEFYKDNTLINTYTTNSSDNFTVEMSNYEHYYNNGWDIPKRSRKTYLVYFSPVPFSILPDGINSCNVSLNIVDDKDNSYRIESRKRTYSITY